MCHPLFLAGAGPGEPVGAAAIRRPEKGRAHNLHNIAWKGLYRPADGGLIAEYCYDPTLITELKTFDIQNITTTMGQKI